MKEKCPECGETYAGFSRRLQRLALAALAPNDKEQTDDRG